TDPYEAQLRHFLHCLEKGEKPRVSAEDAVSALRLSLFALESAFRGTPLSVGAEDPGGVAHWFGPPELPTNPLEETCA
ncbi:MAG: hypothetical protein HYU64_20690, partial [Armatimonadetes bacterium]|nr:hypothetical protein [Armatimonadota bacterium]